MERSNYFDDEFVYSNDLNNTEQTKQNQLIKRTQAPLGYSGGNAVHSSGSVFQGGVYGSPFNNFLYQDFFFAAAIGGTTATIYGGTAISPLGEMIEISSPVTINMGNPTPNTIWTQTPNVTNYIKLAYQETSGSSGVNDLGATFFTRYYPSYLITIDGNAPSASELLLGTFTGGLDGSVYGYSDMRTYVRTVTTADAVMLDPSNVPVAGWTTTLDHIRAKGGATPTQNNPHGLTLADIGAIDSIAQHWVEAHSSAIIDTTGAYPSGLFGSYLPMITGTPLTPAANTYITFALPTTGAAILVDGLIYPNAIGTTFNLIDPVVFSSGDVYYWFYMNSSGSVIVTPTNLINYSTPDKFVLCSLRRVSSGTEYDNFQDLRTFFATTPENIRADFDELSASFPTLGVSSTLVQTLERIRYQLGKAINGYPTNWNLASPPLTAGANSFADFYHTHARTAGSTFAINIGNTGIGYGSLLQMYTNNYPVGLWWDENNQIFNLVQFIDISTTQPASLSVAAIVASDKVSVDLVGVPQILNGTAISDVNNTLRGGPTVSADSLHTHNIGIGKGTIIYASASSLSPVIDPTIATGSIDSMVVNPTLYYQNTFGAAIYLSIRFATNPLSYNINSDISAQASSGSAYLMSLASINVASGSNGDIYTLNAIIPSSWWWRWDIPAGLIGYSIFGYK